MTTQLCRQCATKTKLVSVTPADEGLEDRTFECPKCHERDTLVFSAATSIEDPVMRPSRSGG
jgi:hypothetical protein